LVKYASLFMLLCLSTVGFLSVPARAQVVLPPTFPLQILVQEPVGADLANGLIADAQLSSSGRVCQADYSNQRLTCFAPDGHVLWSEGRKGDGPGEFRAVYRLAIDGADTVYAFDIGSSTISVIAPDGHFVRRAILPFRFRQVDDVIVGTGRTLLISGVAPLAGQAAEFAVHAFQLGDSLRYRRSFGPLPPAKNSETLAYWGAGGISLLPDGGVLFGRRYPYDIFVYDSEGRSQQTLHGPVQLPYGPDQAIHIERTATAIRISEDTTHNVVMPLTPHALSSHLVLTGRRAQDGAVWWDVVPLDAGAPSSSCRFPPEQRPGAVIGVDRGRNYLWAVDNHGDDPSLVRLTYRLRKSR
jgi:hypothetical protein